MAPQDEVIVKRLTGLDIASIAYLLVASTGAVIGARENRVADFAGIKMGQRISVPWVMLWGTALSPPVLLMAVQSALTLIHLQGGKQRRGASAALSVIGLGYTIGALGEPVVYESLSLRTFSPRNAALVCALVGLPLAMSLLGLKEMRGRQTEDQDRSSAA